MRLLLLIFTLLLRLIASAKIYTIAGTESGGSSSGVGTSSKLNYPYQVAVDRGCNVLYLAEFSANMVRKLVQTTGILSTLAGTGGTTYDASCTYAPSCNLNQPLGLVLDSYFTTLYVGEFGGGMVRRIDLATNTISTYAGTGENNWNGDGLAATSTKFNQIHGMAMDSLNNLYIADTANNRVRKIEYTTNIVSTVAGNGQAAYSGDGGWGFDASLHLPRGVAFDKKRSVLYIGDSGNCRIRMVDNILRINTFAGTGECKLGKNDVVRTDAQMDNPEGMDVDQSGNLFFVDTNPAPKDGKVLSVWKVRKVSIDTDKITLIAGTGQSTYSSEQEGIDATSANLYNPRAVSVDYIDNVRLSLSSRIILSY